MIEFPYREERLATGDPVFRPVAEVSLLRASTEWIAEYFYVDSGADYTLIPYRMGQFLGLDETAGDVRDIGGIGGRIGARYARIPIRIGEHEFQCELAWAQIERIPFLLGRQHVFDQFDITFQQRRRRTVFEWRGN